MGDKNANKKLGQREIKFPSKRLKRMRNGLKHKPISSASPQDGAATLLIC